MDALGTDATEQEHVLHGYIESIRTALKARGGKAGFLDSMGNLEFITVVDTAQILLEPPHVAYDERDRER